LIKESGIKVRKIDGTIAGPVFFSKKSYNIFKEQLRPLPSSGGSGNQATLVNTNFLLGCCSRIGLVPGIF